MIELLSFLKHRLSFIVFYVITVIIIACVMYLAGLDMTYARYISVLISFFFLLFMYLDGLRFYRHRKILKTLSDGLYTYLAELKLPPASDALERDYIRLIEELGAAYDGIKKKLAKAQNDSLEYFTLWVHQIKTPIAALRLVLSQADGGNSGTDMTGVIKQELFKIERYADMALRYIKLADIASDLIIEPCELGEAVHETAKKFGILFVYQKLSLDIEPINASVLCDKRWLGFILEQIISNAVKYTVSGGVKIYMDNGSLVVKDSGIGIRSEDLPRVFTKGYTGYNGRIDNRASGIGLYLAKKTADALGITIRIDSKVGEGTAVTLAFPEHDRDIYIN
jgi:signal transduction histidine kinase